MSPPIIAVVIGTRPEAIKMAPVVYALRARLAADIVLVCSGQHRDLVDDVIPAFGLRIDHNLGIMREGQSLPELTASAISAMSNFVSQISPSLVLVQGDTTTVLATAISAFYAGVPLAHVEAGLRTQDLRSPFPEEANRQLTARLAALNFAPTVAAQQALLAEGIPEQKIHITGNTIVDALRLGVARLDAGAACETLDIDTVTSDHRVLITAHRRESFGDGIRSILHAIAELAGRYPGVPFVFPVHPNPNVLRAVSDVFGTVSPSNVCLCSPLGYLSFLSQIRRSTLIITDSGGIQEEAPSFCVPVLVTRQTTERPEGLQQGRSVLVGTNREAIIAAATRVLDVPAATDNSGLALNPFGDGEASRRIAVACERFLLG